MDRFKYHSFVELGTIEVRISRTFVDEMTEESYSKFQGQTTVFKAIVSSYERGALNRDHVDRSLNTTQTSFTESRQIETILNFPFSLVRLRSLMYVIHSLRLKDHRVKISSVPFAGSACWPNLRDVTRTWCALVQG